MKKIILIFLAVMMTESAIASKARLMALGQDSEGSFIVRDNRNIFLNPAQIVTLNNSFNFEMGDINTGVDPNAEGGMIYDLNNGRIGLQLGRRSYVFDQIVLAEAGPTIGDLLTPNNTIDVIYGSNKNSPWGIGVHYGSASSNALNSGFPRRESSELQVYGGILREKLEVYGQLGLNAEAEEKASATAEDKYKGGVYIKGGVSFQIDDVAKVFGSLTKFDYDVTDDTGTKTEVNALVIEVSYARIHKPKNDLMFFYGGGLLQKTGDSETAGTNVDDEELSIPVFVGLEGSATTWMDLRASVSQRVLLNHVENTALDNDHSPNTTTVGAGATLKFTNFLVDATLAGASTNGDIDGNQLFANASILYNF
ncbi:MAG: hypothetical protein SGJ18_10605 [Pseudomonadota bacterium]|nr:hypothetical protein [Pseudomonadota bacterium]